QYQIPIQFVPLEKLNRVTAKNHQGVIAFLSVVEFQPVDEIIHRVFAAGKAPLVVALDGVTDVRNMGAIIRTAECAGVDVVLLPERNSARLGADTVKTSAGAIYHLPISRAGSLSTALKNLKNSGLQIVCASEKAAEPYHKVDLTVPTVLVLGAEDTGISNEIIRMADYLVQIPIFGKIGSLNVSNAAAVLIYETVRQRQQSL
ncbi:MAG TPA: 23S rRNA (guanosine(2251)-2'-O)-methyltransferase RlmB, partial [Salinivirgaceae bacterium]|nr:23S rRNA (guanosine(2251)-2'-O)-methyltransferase RlmB [Salinivirgaceae bacterium]